MPQAVQSAPTAKRREGVSLPRRCYTTSEFADIRGILPASIRTAVWRRGHFMNIVPIKTGSGKSARLLWPAAQVDALLPPELAGEDAA